MFDKCSSSTGMCNAFGHWPTVSLGTVLFFTLSWRVYLYSSDPKYDLQELPECYSWDVFHNTRPFTTSPQTCPALSPFVAVTKTPCLIHAIPNTIMRQWNSKSGHEIRLTWFHNFTGVRGQLHVPVTLHLQKEHPTLEEWDTTILDVIGDEKLMCPCQKWAHIIEAAASRLTGSFWSNYRQVLRQLLTPTRVPKYTALKIKMLNKCYCYVHTVHIDTGRKILDKIYINQAVRQGCNLSPALFNIYIDDLPKKLETQSWRWYNA